MKTIKNLTADELRKSILQLAIQGKLVKQDPNDEPASELVKKIHKEKKKLIAEGKIKKDKNESHIFKGDDNCYYEKIGNNEPVKLDDLPFDIPDNWMWIRFGNLVNIQTGASFKKEQAIQNYKNDYIRVLRGGNILPFWYILKDDDLYIPKKLVNKNILLNKNDLITPAVTSLENIGKVSVIDRSFNNITVGGFVYIFRINLNNSWISKIIMNFMSSPIFLELLKSITKKSGQAFYNINKERLKTLYFALPPLNEQQRIVDKINSFEPLLQEYETLEKKLTQLELTFTEELKKSILQLAIQGKLVKQDPNDEPASELVKKIYEEKRKLIADGKIKKDKNESYIFKCADKNYYEKIGKNEPVKLNDLPFDIPSSWAWICIENIVNSISSKQYQIKETEVKGTGKYKVISQSKEYSIGYSNIESKVYKHKEPAIVFGDHTTIIKFIDFDFIVGADGLKIFEPKIKYINANYLYHVLFYNADGLDQIGGYSRHYKYLKEKLIPLPPLKEQKRIVNKINTLFDFLKVN